MNHPYLETAPEHCPTTPLSIGPEAAAHEATAIFRCTATRMNVNAFQPVQHRVFPNGWWRIVQIYRFFLRVSNRTSVDSFGGRDDVNQ